MDGLKIIEKKFCENKFQLKIDGELSLCLQMIRKIIFNFILDNAMAHENFTQANVSEKKDF